MAHYPNPGGERGRPVPTVHFRGACPCGATHPNRAPYLQPYESPNMKYADVIKGMSLVEVVDRAKFPKRVARRIVVRKRNLYSAEVEIIKGRGAGDVIHLFLKRLTDSSKWTVAR